MLAQGFVGKTDPWRVLETSLVDPDIQNHMKTHIPNHIKPTFETILKATVKTMLRITLKTILKAILYMDDISKGNFFIYVKVL